MTLDRSSAKKFKTATKLSHLGRKTEVTGGVGVNPPMQRASTLLFESLEEFNRGGKRKGDLNFSVYGRFGTEPRFSLEELLAELEGADRAMTVPSGLAAVTLALMAFVKKGDHVLIADAVYTPARNLARDWLERFGVETEFYDPRIGADIERLFRDNTKLLYLESPGTWTFEIQDVPLLAEKARKRGIITAIDNTWATPLFFKPLDYGVDVSLSAGTKYIVGHSDAMIGTLAANEETFEALFKANTLLGYSVAPEDAAYALRGLRTLNVRLERHQKTALELGAWLEEQPEIQEVIHPGLPSHPDHALWKRDFTGATGLFSIILKPCSDQALSAFADHLRFFGIGASWGGYESLVIPVYPERQRTAVPWTKEGHVLRLHVGLEELEDLKLDLAEGFERLRKAEA